jgi:ABC-type multidrug transport system fused ATPase/permease subunit
VLNWYVRMSSDRESQIVAVERLQEYADLSPEAPAAASQRPPPDWPQHGTVEFDDCKMRYRPGLPLVLKGEQNRGLSCTIQAGQKVRRRRKS